MEMECTFHRLSQREHFLLPCWSCYLASLHGLLLSLTQYKKLYILFVLFVHLSFRACQLAGTQVSVFIFAQPKPLQTPVPSVSPTVAQETQNLNIQGLPSVSEGTLIQDTYQATRLFFFLFFYLDSQECT